MKPICLLTIVVAFAGSGYELNHYRNQFSFYQHQGFATPQGETATVLVRVTDKQSVPISGVRVCLTQKPRYIYKIGWTDSQGEALFVLYQNHQIQSS